MKNVFYSMFALLVAVVSCSRVDCTTSEDGHVDIGHGVLAISLKYDTPLSKAVDGYDFVLNEESQVNGVEVLVFDSESGRLERSMSMASVSDECVFELPVGSKVIYALVNGPELSRVRSLDDFFELSENLMDRDYLDDGFVMIGSSSCDVVKGVVSRPEIVVGRMVSRVVLNSVTCNIARQYESLSIDCIFLGNANLEQNFRGECSDMVNIDGYQDLAKEIPVGLDGVVGECSRYLYRQLGCELSVGETYAQPVCLYCQPNASQNYTTLYMLVTIDGEQYYYGVPLDKGLSANTSCAIDAVITNVGSALSPDGLVQKGELEVVISIDDWAMGYIYNAEF